MQPLTLDRLPEDILFSIAIDLDVIAALKGVCKKFFEIAQRVEKKEVMRNPLLLRTWSCLSKSSRFIVYTPHFAEILKGSHSALNYEVNRFVLHLAKYPPVVAGSREEEQRPDINSLAAFCTFMLSSGKHRCLIGEASRFFADYYRALLIHCQGEDFDGSDEDFALIVDRCFRKFSKEDHAFVIGVRCKGLERSWLSTEDFLQLLEKIGKDKDVPPQEITAVVIALVERTKRNKSIENVVVEQTKKLLFPKLNEQPIWLQAPLYRYLAEMMSVAKENGLSEELLLQAIAYAKTMNSPELAETLFISDTCFEMWTNKSLHELFSYFSSKVGDDLTKVYEDTLQQWNILNLFFRLYLHKYRNRPFIVKQEWIAEAKQLFSDQSPVNGRSEGKDFKERSFLKHMRGRLLKVLEEIAVSLNGLNQAWAYAQIAGMYYATNSTYGGSHIEKVDLETIKRRNPSNTLVQFDIRVIRQILHKLDDITITKATILQMVRLHKESCAVSLAHEFGLQEDPDLFHLLVKAKKADLLEGYYAEDKQTDDQLELADHYIKKSTISGNREARDGAKAILDSSAPSAKKAALLAYASFPRAVCQTVAKLESVDPVWASELFAVLCSVNGLQ